MPMDNSLNVSELLKRIGVVGDSLGSAPLLEEMRPVVQVADLSDLVAPYAVPRAGAGEISTAGAGNFNKWALHCRSPGGALIEQLGSNGARAFHIWISDANAFVAGSAVTSKADITGGQPTLSDFILGTPSPQDRPAGAFYRARFGDDSGSLYINSYIRPGQFFNIESGTSNETSQIFSLIWKEFPGAISP